jgi:preprotein translocase subunit SecG
MSAFLNILLAIQMLVALIMIGLILLQQGKGADMGAAFGSGSSGSLFGATGGANFMSRTTAVLAAIFFVCTLTLAYFGNLKQAPAGSVLEGAAPASVPAANDPAAAIPKTAPSAPGTPAVPPAAPAAGSANQQSNQPATGAAQIPTK